MEAAVVVVRARLGPSGGVPSSVLGDVGGRSAAAAAIVRERWGDGERLQREATAGVLCPGDMGTACTLATEGDGAAQRRSSGVDHCRQRCGYLNLTQK